MTNKDILKELTLVIDEERSVLMHIDQRGVGKAAHNVLEYNIQRLAILHDKILKDENDTSQSK